MYGVQKPKYKGETSWVPISIAVQILRISRQRVRQLYLEDKLLGKKVGHTILINLRSIEAREALMEREGRYDRSIQ